MEKIDNFIPKIISFFIFLSLIFPLKTNALTCFSANFTITVKDASTNNPIEGAKCWISYYDCQNYLNYQTVYSNSSGICSFSGFYGNNDQGYYWEVSKDGYNSANGHNSSFGSITVNLTPSGAPPPCDPTTCTNEFFKKQQKIQYRCTKGACGGVIEFIKRIAERNCYRERQCQNDQCVRTGRIICSDWINTSTEVIKEYDTSDKPWLVCTYRYDQLTTEEKTKANINYPSQYSTIICKEGNCPEVEEVTFFPLLTDKKEYASEAEFNADDGKMKEGRFFEIAQITCWGKCLKPVGQNPHYFAGAIDPARENIEGQEQNPEAVRLPVKLGWEFDKKSLGVEEWEEAIDKAREKSKENLERGGSYIDPPKNVDDFKQILGVSEFEKKFLINVDGRTLIRDSGVGSFKLEKPVERFLPLEEGQSIPHWQTPASGGSDLSWSRLEMAEYFDYYFLNKIIWPEDNFKFGFDGKLKDGELFVYSPSQDSKEDYLWVQYQDPNENNLTKQIRLKKSGSEGPCQIPPFTVENFLVYPCCGKNQENCYPNTEKRDWKFNTLGPEPKSILGIKVEKVRKIFPFDGQQATKMEGKIYRFIDIDWDRIWPTEEFIKKKGLECSLNNFSENYFVGMASFDQVNNPENQCKKECQLKCDQECLKTDTCQRQCEIEQKENCEKMGGKDCQKVAQEYCQKLFGEIRKTGCPNCKTEEKKMGCLVCKECEERYSCQKKCEEDCYERIKNKWKEEVMDCDEICTGEVDLIAARGECQKINDEKKRMICQRCQNCSYKVDLVDIEWCGNVSGDFAITSISYKGKWDRSFSIQDFYGKENLETCQAVSTPSICQKDQCQCFKYNQNGSEIYPRPECPTCIKDIFFPHPQTLASNLKFKCQLTPWMKEEDCFGIYQLNIYDSFKDSKLVSMARRGFEKWKVVRDFYQEKFGDLNQENQISGEYSIPISLYDEKPTGKFPWFEWDKLNQLFNSFLPIGWQIGVCQGSPFDKETKCQGSGLRWDFKIKTLPKTLVCNYLNEDCFGESERDFPSCWGIDKTKITFYPTPEKDIEKDKAGLNRIALFKLPTVDRILSYRLKIKSGKNYLDLLPKIPTQTPVQIVRESTEEKRKFPAEFPFWEIWNSLPPLEKGKERLEKEFELQFFPCWDENGFYCSKNPIEQKIEITGKPPSVPFKESTSGPPPPKKIRIPHYFDWDPSLGAASYWLKFEGPQNLEVFVPDINLAQKSKMWVDLKEDGEYSWRIRTCADLCSANNENLLQCGDYSEKLSFEGYTLYPPTEHTPVEGEYFLPEEIISLSWKPIAKGTDCTQILVKYLNPVGEKRKDCQEKAGSYFLINEIKEGKIGEITIPKETFPTSAEIYEDKETGIKTNICLGTYAYQIRYCTGENCAKKKEDCPSENLDCQLSSQCQEAGDWSVFWTFNLATKKPPPIEIGQGGFSTCKNLIPCKNCTLKDIPVIIYNIINCILWTLSPAAIIALTIYTGLVFYFSLGAAETLGKVKGIWKAFGIGWLIMLLSEITLKFILKFLGYTP